MPMQQPTVNVPQLPQGQQLNYAPIFSPQNSPSFQPMDLLGMLSSMDPNSLNQLLSQLKPEAIQQIASIPEDQIPQEKRGMFDKVKNFFGNAWDGFKSAGKSIKEGLGSQPGQFSFYTPYAPQQQDAITSALNMALQGLQDPSAGFEPIANQARNEFQQQTIPSIAERFSALGGGQRSSAFGQSLGQAGANFQNQLAAQQAQFGLQRGNQLQQLLNTGLTPQFEANYQAGSPNIFKALAPAAGEIAGKALSAALI